MTFCLRSFKYNNLVESSNNNELDSVEESIINNYKEEEERIVSNIKNCTLDLIVIGESEVNKTNMVIVVGYEREGKN